MLKVSIFKTIGVFLFATILTVISCVSPYEIRVKEELKTILVEAYLTDEDKQQKIKITASNYLYESPFNEAIPNLQVEVLVNGFEKIALKDEGSGIYAMPISFRGKAGNSYQLFFKKQDSTQYKSDTEKLVAAPAIQNLRDVFFVKGVTKDNKQIPSNTVYLDFKDDQNRQNYYLWTWTLWERQYVCFSTDFYDLYCNQDCWQIFYNQDLNIMADTYFNGKTIINKVVAEIPYYQEHGSLFEIKQQSISASAFEFLKKIQTIGQNTGTLADTPPEAIIGNVRNISNPEEIVVGMFMAKGVSSVEYWLKRENALGKATPIGVLGRKPNIGATAVTYPCVPGPNKTPIKPRNWID